MTPADPDIRLMLRYRDGDAAAFDALYNRHKDGLYRYLLGLCLDTATAEDLFQEAWGKVIAARHRYRPTARFSTYLYRVAHNCFVDHYRRRRHRGREEDADAVPLTAAEGDPGGTAGRAARCLPAARGRRAVRRRDRGGDRGGPRDGQEPAALCLSQAA
jgi:RNA polymerase sigma-70 factor (ECF subfamily)